jgi:hypothetical protein
MQVDGQYTVDTGAGQHVGYQFGGNRHTGGTRTTVLTGVAKIRDGCGNPAGRSTLERVGHGQDFHQVVIGGGTGGLQDEHIATADILQQFDSDFAIAELADIGTAQEISRCLTTF